jgi:hypothetical protein
MTFFKAVPTMFCAALIGAAFSPSVKADEWNQKTVITFDQPVETPGVHLKGWAVLPAGTYVFKLLGSQSDRHIVQIYNQDETVVYATVLAIPDYRIRPTGKTVLTFRETEGKSSRIGEGDQRASPVHESRDPGRSRRADHLSRGASGRAVEGSAGRGSEAHWRRR